MKVELPDTNRRRRNRVLVLSAALPSKTVLDTDGEYSVLVILKDMEPGPYKMKITVKENDLLISGSDNIQIEKKDLEGQKNTAEKAETAGKAVGAAGTASLTTALVVNAIFNFLFQNLFSDGFLLKYSMIIKLINRLRYINVQYGMALGIFLFSIGDMNQLKENSNKANIEKYSKSKRGKFYEYGT